ncbi:unnamed protein product [Caenorhabditis auriculariae]|uniref:Protein HTATIP2 n=1 Tax=Caenorhabditis auriculariae TaxID=2777116 RepID=A0A8S1H7U5_9PELO|nr:unnamed protein product [Caenorhabditis auriculariae]
MDEDEDLFLDFGEPTNSGNNGFDVEMKEAGDFRPLDETLRKEREISDLVQEYEKLQDEMAEVDELARQIKNGILICRQMELCYSDRKSNAKNSRTIVNSFEIRYLSNGSALLLVSITNVTDISLDGWSLCVTWFSSNENKNVPRVCCSQTIRIGDLPAGYSKTFQLLVEDGDFRLPLLFYLTILREFRLGDVSKVFRIQLDTQVLTIWQQVTVSSASKAVAAGNSKKITPAAPRFSVFGSFEIRLPHTLVDLLCGCPDIVETGNVFKAILPTSCHPQISADVTDVDCVVCVGPKAQNFQLKVLREPRQYLLTVSARDSAFLTNLQSQLEVFLVVEMSNAFVVGATGAVGSELVKLLASASYFDKVSILARRNVDGATAEKFEQKTVNFDELEKSGDSFEGIDVGFCALGTTRAKSGADGFVKVDHDYVVNTAKLAKEHGVKQFVLISSAGANECSPFLYPKTKGQVEKEIAEIGFEKLVIIRPGLIEAPRPETRVMESIAKFVIKPFKLVSDSLASSATEIAKTMIVAAISDEVKDKAIWNNAKIIASAKKFDNNEFPGAN